MTPLVLLLELLCALGPVALMGECNLGGAAVESAGMVRGGRWRAHYANNAPLRARSGVEVEQDVEDYR